MTLLRSRKAVITGGLHRADEDQRRLWKQVQMWETLKPQKLGTARIAWRAMEGQGRLLQMGKIQKRQKRAKALMARGGSG